MDDHQVHLGPAARNKADGRADPRQSLSRRAVRRSREGDGPQVGYRRGRGTHSPFLLSGLVRCEACGHAFQGYTTTKSKARKSGEKVKTLYYCCGGYITTGSTVCRRVLFRQDALDDVVARLFSAAPEDPRPELARLRKRKPIGAQRQCQSVRAARL